MKSTYLLLLPILFVGCASAPKLTCDEACAMNGMVCTGMTMSDATTVSTERSRNFFDPPARTNTVHDSSATSYQCAKDPSQEAKIQSIRQSVAEREAAQKGVRRAYSPITN